VEERFAGMVLEGVGGKDVHLWSYVFSFLEQTCKGE
jgi:hypothetical protein